MQAPLYAPLFPVRFEQLEAYYQTSVNMLLTRFSLSRNTPAPALPLTLIVNFIKNECLQHSPQDQRHALSLSLDQKFSVILNSPNNPPTIRKSADVVRNLLEVIVELIRPVTQQTVEPNPSNVRNISAMHCIMQSMQTLAQPVHNAPSRQLFEQLFFDPAKEANLSNVDQYIETNVTMFQQLLQKKVPGHVQDHVRKRAMDTYRDKLQDIRLLPQGSPQATVFEVIMQAQQAAFRQLGEDGTIGHRLKATRLAKQVGQISEIMQKILKTKLERIDAILRLEAKGIPRADLVNGKLEKEIDAEIRQSSEAKQQHEQKKLELLVAELSVEDEKPKKRTSAKKNRSIKRGAVSKTNPPKAKNESHKDPKPIEPSKIELRAQHNLSFYKRKTLQEHPRVTKRWQQASPQEIRAFTDNKANGERVRRYATLSDSELVKWKAFHYLPGSEKVLAVDIDRQIYSYTTERGLSMIGTMQLNDGTVFYGTLSFGIDTAGTLYHRCFEPVDIRDLDKALLQIPERAQDIPEQSEVWHTHGACSYEFQDGGNLSFTYQDDKGNFTHSLTIYPLRRDLLTTHYDKIL